MPNMAFSELDLFVATSIAIASDEFWEPMTLEDIAAFSSLPAAGIISCLQRLADGGMHIDIRRGMGVVVQFVRIYSGELRCTNDFVGIAEELAVNIYQNRSLAADATIRTIACVALSMTGVILHRYLSLVSIASAAGVDARTIGRTCRRILPLRKQVLNMDHGDAWAHIDFGAGLPGGGDGYIEC